MSPALTAAPQAALDDLQGMVRSITARPDLHIEPVEEGARTDGKTVYLPAPELATLGQDVEMSRVVTGLALHESSHVLWTNFQAFRRFQEGKRFPKIAALVLNLLEDPRVETFMANLHPLSQGYIVAAHRHYSKGEAANRNLSPKVRANEPIEPASKLLRAWMLKLFNGATPKGLGRLQAVYKAGLDCLPPAYWYACAMEETIQRSERLYRLLESVAISEEGAPGVDTKNWADGAEDPVKSGKLEAGAKPAPAGSGRGLKPVAGKPKPGSSAPGAGKPSAPTPEAGAEEGKEEDGGEQGAASTPGEEAEDEGEAPPPSGNVHSDGNGGGGSIRMNIRTLEQRAEDSKDPLEWVSRKSHNGSKHTKGDYPVLVHKPAEKPEAYRQMVAHLRPLIRKVVLALEETLRFDDDLEEGHRQGRINRRTLPYVFARDDIFSARLTGKTVGEVGVQILVDASGSMSGIMGSVQEATIAFHEALLELGISHGISAHTTGDRSVMLLDYIRPGSPRAHSSRLASMSAMSGNRDGTAVRTVANYLKARPENYKLLLVLNDGLPSDYSSGENGFKDTQDAVREASAFSQVVGIWLGSNTPADKFAEIYPDHIACEDVNQLPRFLAKQLARFVGIA